MNWLRRLVGKKPRYRVAAWNTERVLRQGEWMLPHTLIAKLALQILADKVKHNNS